MFFCSLYQIMHVFQEKETFFIGLHVLSFLIPIVLLIKKKYFDKKKNKEVFLALDMNNSLHQYISLTIVFLVVFITLEVRVALQIH